MSIHKRGGVYWYEFEFKGKVVCRNTGQADRKIALGMQEAHRCRLEKKASRREFLREMSAYVSGAWSTVQLCRFVKNALAPVAEQHIAGAAGIPSSVAFGKGGHLITGHAGGLILIKGGLGGRVYQEGGEAVNDVAGGSRKPSEKNKAEAFNELVGSRISRRAVRAVAERRRVWLALRHPKAPRLWS